MRDDVRVAVLYGFGINCDHETKAVFELVGATAERVHVNELVNGSVDLAGYDIMAVPGGFSFGDHLGSGRLLGNRLRFTLRDSLKAFVEAKKPIIGICNGFQVLVKTGLLPGPDGHEPDFIQRASLTLNDSGRYEDRWVTLEFDPDSPCIWTKGMVRMECPVRHGEGKFVMPHEADVAALKLAIAWRSGTWTAPTRSVCTAPTRSPTRSVPTAACTTLRVCVTPVDWCSG